LLDEQTRRRQMVKKLDPMLILLNGVLAMVVSACGGEAGSVCEQAAAHMQSCGVVVADVGDTCDPNDAAKATVVLGVPCADLQNGTRQAQANHGELCMFDSQCNGGWCDWDVEVPILIDYWPVPLVGHCKGASGMGGHGCDGDHMCPPGYTCRPQSDSYWDQYNKHCLPDDGHDSSFDDFGNGDDYDDYDYDDDDDDDPGPFFDIEYK
jgi:hypothetical protein